MRAPTVYLIDFLCRGGHWPSVFQSGTVFAHEITRKRRLSQVKNANRILRASTQSPVRCRRGDQNERAPFWVPPRKARFRELNSSRSSHASVERPAPNLRTGFCVQARRALSDGGGATKMKEHPFGCSFILEAPPGIGPGIEVLQTFALPLGHGAIFA